MVQGVRGILAVVFVSAAVIIAACGENSNSPSAPSTVVASAASHAGHLQSIDNPSDHNSAAHDDKGYIDGWYNGETVQLHYTKWYFCTEPPDSAAASHCELGADAETAPRPGPIPTIYAIAAAGIVPDLSTLACPPGSVCLNHPAMLDASRVLGPGASNINGVPHSHIVTERRGGWFHTVNIRVRNLAAWNQIADAKSLDKVRELQADPNFGGAGLVSADTATNIYFFIASWK
jgi:hypothetical protein